jgi:hypothetical protein
LAAVSKARGCQIVPIGLQSRAYAPIHWHAVDHWRHVPNGRRPVLSGRSTRPHGGGRRLLDRRAEALVHLPGAGRDDPNPKRLCDDRLATGGIWAGGPYPGLRPWTLMPRTSSAFAVCSASKVERPRRSTFHTVALSYWHIRTHRPVLACHNAVPILECNRWVRYGVTPGSASRIMIRSLPD